MRSGVLFVNNIFVVAKINDQYVPLKINGCLLSKCYVNER